MGRRKVRRVRPVRRLAQPLSGRLAILGLTTALGLGLVGVPVASGDPGGDGGTSGGAFPSQEQVDRAKARAEQKAHDVGAIKARLLLANQRLDAANVRAEQASEAYNGAMWRLEQAKQAYRQARADAEHARRTVASQRNRIGALVAQSYQNGGDLTALNAMMSADGPQGVMDQYVAFQGASTSLQADYKRFAAADALAQVFEGKARHAKAKQVRLAAEAAQARDAAVASADAAQAEATDIAAEKEKLITQLAAAQNISVDLARQRQAALEEIARKRAEERARLAAIAEAKAKAAAEAKARAEAAAQQRAQQKAAEEAARKKAADQKAAQDKGKSGSDGGNGGGSGGSGGDDPPSDPTPPTPDPPTPPAPPAPPAPSGGVGAALAYARQQLGEPYRWGATGPTSWDCSGLTMRAWESAGMYLPHYSVAQYEAGTPIPVGEARAGDLLFWTSNGRPSGIHHVALYLGDGDFIEAPHTGANVRYNSIYAWYPDFAVRL
jgi:cell wall-associated NlpC family hydrolase